MKKSLIALFLLSLLCVSPAMAEERVLPKDYDTMYTLTFGLGSDVTEEEFNAFVEAELAPSFPLGFFIQNAQGRWTTPEGKLIREANKIVKIAVKNTPDTLAKRDAAVKAFGKKFSSRNASVFIMTTDIKETFMIF